MSRSLSSLILLVFLLTFSASFAQDKEPSATGLKDLEARLYKGLTDASKAGVTVYNVQRDPAGCYRLFQGALLGALPFLEHRPILKKAIEKGLEEAEGLTDYQDRAFALRKVLDNTRKALKEGITKSLWDRLGGEAAVNLIAHDFLTSALKDPKVNFDRGGTVKLNAEQMASLEKHLVELLSQVSGGPLKYTGKDMKALHATMKITDAEFDALASHLKATLQKHKVPDAEIDELAKIVESTRKDVVAEKKPEPPMKEALWKRLGGEEGVKKVVRDFVVAAAADPKVNFSRGGKYKLDNQVLAYLETQLVDLVSQVSGGPQVYTGKDMKTVHAGMKITDAEFDALAGHLTTALKKHKVSQEAIDELVGIVAGMRKDIVENP